MGYVLLLSDIHANDVALEWVLKDVRYRFRDIEEVWFLGDLLGYGPHPLEVIERVRGERGIYSELSWIMGNHDAMLKYLLEAGQVSEKPPAGQSPVAWLSWREHYNILRDSEQKEWYWSFLESGKGPRILSRGEWQVVLTHGTLIRDADNVIRDAIEIYAFPWISPEFTRAYFISPLDGRLEGGRCMVVYGHTHIPTCRKVVRKEDGEIVFVELLQAYGEPISFRGGECVLLNPGSVGFPRDSDPRASYAVLDLEAEEVTFYRVPYPQREVAAVLTKELGWYELARRVMEGTLARSPGEIGVYMEVLERRKRT